jgi:hypothetical protein
VDIRQFCIEHSSIKESQEMLKKVMAEMGYNQDTQPKE